VVSGRPTTTRTARDIRIITATSQTQGQRDSDFNWCVEGELVMHAAATCDRGREEGPGGGCGCGCGRAFVGLNSHQADAREDRTDIDGFDLEDLAAAAVPLAGRAEFAAASKRQHGERRAAFCRDRHRCGDVEAFFLDPAST
jgi:hypothetical protein